MLFAELFSLVNSSSEETNKDSENNLVNINESVNNLENSLITKQNNNFKKTEDLAKSLAQIFYKDLGISQEKENENKNLLSTNFVDKKKSTTEVFVNLNQKKSNQTQNVIKQVVFDDDNSNKNAQSQKITIAIAFAPTKKNNKTDSAMNLKNDLKTKNLETENKVQLANTVKSKIEELNLQKNQLIFQDKYLRKKTSKKKQSSIIIKSKEEENETVKNTISVVKNLNQKKIIALKNTDGADNLQKTKKEKNTQLFENKIKSNKLFTTPETLNLMESSWGEKFSKMIRNAVANGLNKVQITLKPKSLGKINLDISVKDNSTKIQINAENLESANLLNENLGKINELIESKNEKFSGFFDGGSNNHFNNKKKQRVVDNPQINNKKKSVDNKKVTISNHNIDVQA